MDQEAAEGSMTDLPYPQAPARPARLRHFVTRFTELVETTSREDKLLTGGAGLLRQLVGVDDWLPAAYAEEDPERYRQYLLHCDPWSRFSMVSFVWGPGQATPVHDHRVWGLVGMLRGGELVENFVRDAEGGIRSLGPPQLLKPGEVDGVGPSLGDIHRVSNAYPDRVSISIHVYGANIGEVERATYDADGREKRFVSGYSNKLLPNIWADA